MSKETGKRKFNRLKLFHLNAQSLKNRDHLIQIRVIAQNVDILAISESWLNSSISNAEIEIQDYEVAALWTLELAITVWSTVP
jgi:hypothetical protein